MNSSTKQVHVPVLKSRQGLAEHNGSSKWGYTNNSTTGRHSTHGNNRNGGMKCSLTSRLMIQHVNLVVLVRRSCV